MPFTWEALYSLLSPPALRDTSPSLFSSPFSSQPNEATQTKKTDLPMPPTSAFGAAAAPSPAESSTSLAASERDYFLPTSPYTHRSPSMSSTSTASTIPPQIQRTNTTPPSAAAASTTSTTLTTTTGTKTDANPVEADRPAGPRRSATEIVAPEPLSREFPKPAHEPSLDELLARPPGKWSLGHYVKHARPSKVALAAAAGASETKSEERARKFEETKRELRRAKEEMERLASTRR